MGKDDRRKQDPITEELFREVYQFEEIPKISWPKRILKKLKCSKQSVLASFPFALWIKNYSLKNDLLGDIIAGFTVAVMHIPHGLAYAPLGKVGPVVGFYMAIFPVFVYILMGSSKHISIGTFALICAMAGEVVVSHQGPKHGSDLNSTAMSGNGTAEGNTSSYSSTEIVAALCIMVGIWQTVLGILHLGFLSFVMSESLVAGYTMGAAFHVLTYQLKNLFGLELEKFSGIFKLYFIYVDFFKKIKNVNVVTMSISFLAISVLLVFSEVVKPLLQKKFPRYKIPLPMELIIVFVGTSFSYFLNLSQTFQVKIVGAVPTGFPEPMVPPINLLPVLIVDSFAVAVVATAINLSMATILGKKAGYLISSNQELLAYGFANIFSSFFRCLPSAASLSRSAIQFGIGGKTQLASLFSIFLIIIILLVAGPLFEPVPYCVLSAIVVVSLKNIFKQVKHVPRICKGSYWDGFVWTGTFLSVLILGLDYGLCIGAVLSVLSLIQFTRKVRIEVLGRVPNTDIFLDVDHFRSVKSSDDILILKVEGSISFANSNDFEDEIFNQYLNFFGSSSHQSYLVLDMECVSQVDPTGVNCLEMIHQRLKKFNCDLYLTNCNLKLYSTLEKCNFFVKFPREQVLASVGDAANYLETK